MRRPHLFSTAPLLDATPLVDPDLVRLTRSVGGNDREAQTQRMRDLHKRRSVRSARLPVKEVPHRHLREMRFLREFAEAHVPCVDPLTDQHLSDMPSELFELTGLPGTQLLLGHPSYSFC